MKQPPHSKPISTSPEHRAQYRERLLRALRALRNHRGTEGTFNEFIERSAELEQWMAEVFGSEGSVRLPNEDEREVSRTYHRGQSEITIQDLLQMAADRLKRIEAPNILTIKIPQVILPTEAAPPLAGNGEATFEQPRIQPRFRQLITLLQSKGIFTDDLIVLEGEVTPNMVRSVPYALVEIPRLQRQVLVCNEVGEATFVSQEMLSRDTFTEYTKEQLLDARPSLIRIVYRYQAQWETEVWNALKGDAQELGQKVDIKSQEEIRIALRERFSAAEWVEMKRPQRLGVQIGRRKMNALFGVFNIRGKGIYERLAFLHLGAAIWGGDEQLIRQAIATEESRVKEVEGVTADDIRKDLLQRFTAEQWVAMTLEERTAVTVRGGHKQLAIGTKLGIPGNEATKLRFLLCGEELFGKENPTIKAALQQEQITKEQLREKIKATYTPQEWVSMKQRRRNKMDIGGLGRVAMIGVFEIPDTGNEHLAFLLLGAAIWGESEPMIQEKIGEKQKVVEDHAIPLDTLRDLIKKQYTPQEWVAKDSLERKKVSVLSRGIIALKNLFGIDRELWETREGFLLLGEKIWGAEEPIIQTALKELRMNTDELRATITKRYTATEWLAIPIRERRAIEIADMKLMAIAKKFDIDGKVLHQRLPFLKLSAAIWGSEEPIFQEIIRLDESSPEEIKMELRKRYSPGEWVTMKIETRRSLEIGSRKIQALALYLGMKSYKTGQLLPLFELGAIIWGGEEPTIKAALEKERARKRREALRVSALRSPDL